MARVINSISDIFCVVSFYLIRSWDVGDTFPWALKISAMYLRYVVPTTPGNNVNKFFIWLAVIFKEKYVENFWKFWKKKSMDFLFGWHVGTLLHPMTSLVHTARSIVPQDDEITSLSALWIFNGSALSFALIFFPWGSVASVTWTPMPCEIVSITTRAAREQIESIRNCLWTCPLYCMIIMSLSCIWKNHLQGVLICGDW